MDIKNFHVEIQSDWQLKWLFAINFFHILKIEERDITWVDIYAAFGPMWRNIGQLIALWWSSQW